MRGETTRVDGLADLRVALGPALLGVVVEEVELQEPARARVGEHDVGGAVLLHREDEVARHEVGAPRRREGAGQILLLHPRLDLGVGVALLHVAGDDDEAGVVAVERELDRGAHLGGAGRPLELVEQGVDVLAVGEHATVAVQVVHLDHRPVVPVVVVALEHPVDRQVRPGDVVRAHGHVGVGRVAQVLHAPGGDEAVTGELPRGDHAARVEVVVLVPAVVLHLVAPLGLHHREQQGAQLDGVVVDSGDGHGVLLRTATWGDGAAPTLACF